MPHDALAVTLQCIQLALRPVCLMFLLCFALAMPKPSHLPVLRCCAAAVRAAPREYRARSVFLLGFAILLRAFAMFLNSSRRDCHVFAVLCGAFGIALSIPCGSTLARTCRSCACRVVHRDLEPANILAMLDQVGTTVLHVTNFSKARDLPRRGRRRLRAKAFVDHASIKPNTRVQGWTPGVCTLLYCAPELLWRQDRDERVEEVSKFLGEARPD